MTLDTHKWGRLGPWTGENAASQKLACLLYRVDRKQGFCTGQQGGGPYMQINKEGRTMHM